MVGPAQPLVGHRSNNKPFPGSSANTAAVMNPATGQGTGRVALATSEHARAVIDAAQTGVATWRDASLAKGTAVPFKFRELLYARKGETAAILSGERGKVLSDEMGEVSRGKEVIELACGFHRLVKVSFAENASTGVDGRSVRQSLGDVGDHFPVHRPGNGADAVPTGLNLGFPQNN